jgi:phospholipid/cholesterol/gamma-HCH transport system substrate-binding protein
VTEGTPIRRNGILIGRVKKVTPMIDGVVVELAINDDVDIYDNDTCSIGSDSILGDAMIEFVAPETGERGNPVPRDQDYNVEIVSVKPNPMQLVGDLTPKLDATFDAIRTASVGVNQASEDVQKLTNTIQSAFENEDSDFKKMTNDFREMTAQAQLALNNIDRFFGTAANFIEDPQLEFNLKQAIWELGPIMTKIGLTLDQTRETVREFQSIPNGVNENLDNLKTFTESLKTEGPEVLEKLNSSLKNADELIAQVKTFTSSLKKLENSDGTLGKLINDPELYNSLLKTANTLQREVAKIEPTINDIRMFTDAIARDPGVLGVRGALDRRPGKTGYKGTAGRDGGRFK